MTARPIDRVETAVELAAGAIFGGAVAYAAYQWLSVFAPQPRWAYSAAAGVLSAALCIRLMRVSVRRTASQLSVRMFDVREIELEMDELILTEADRTGSTELVLTEEDRVAPPAATPLMLDDILAELGPDSRVVRLFDPKTMPNPAELKTRIDDHLGRRVSPAALSDASQALSAALAELRRSLR